MTVEELIELLKAVDGQTKKAVTPADVNTSTLMTQPNGIFSVTGLENDVINASITPRGIIGALPAFGSGLEDPRYGLLTGYTATTGSEPTNPCDPAPAGFVKSGTLTAAFGRIARDTQTIEIDELLKEQRGASTNLRLIGEVLGMPDLHPPSLSSAQILDLVTKHEMVIVGVNLERKLAETVWQGSPANNTAGGGYREFPGLDNQIATGQVDAETNVAIPAADSDIKDFNYDAVDGTNRDIVEYMSMMEFYLAHNSDRMGLSPVRQVIVMRPNLWFELSAVWPCRYLTHRCATSAGANPVVINDNNNVTMRDAMRNGMYIDINGNRYPVMTDDGIFEHTNVNNANVAAGSYASSIYFLPLRVAGNFPATYMEYKDYRQISGQLAPLGEGMKNVPFWTDGGRFLWVYHENGFCFKLSCKTEMRIILRTPQLAGKIQNVLYSPLQHTREPFPDSPYFYDGGASLRSTATSGYAVWA